MRVWKLCVLFYLGGMTYMALEFLWRGRSHGSMFLLGGACFLLIGKLNRWLRKISFAIKLLVFSGAITMLELITGLLINRSYRIWDYRQMPYNYLGQVCLNYSLLWIPVSFVAAFVYTWADKKLSKG